jgi:hypothetical protein
MASLAHTSPHANHRSGPSRIDDMERPTFDPAQDPFALNARQASFSTLLATPETIDNASVFANALMTFGQGVEFSHSAETTVDLGGRARPGLLRCIETPGTQTFAYGHSGQVVSILSTSLGGEINLASLTVSLPGGASVPLGDLPADQLPNYLRRLKIAAVMVARNGFGSRFAAGSADRSGKKSAAVPPYQASRSRQARTASGS